MIKQRVLFLLATLVLGVSSAMADTPAPAPMQRYVIERVIPGAGKMTADQLRAAAAKSNKVLMELGPDIQWVQSYVTGDKLYCVYNARSEEVIKRHAERSGFPASHISAVTAVIDPTTAH